MYIKWHAAKLFEILAVKQQTVSFFCWTLYSHRAYPLPGQLLTNTYPHYFGARIHHHHS